MEIVKKELLYENKLSCQADVADFIAEGTPSVAFSDGKMQLSNGLDSALGSISNYLFWCPVSFPDHIQIEWKFRPLREPGLAMMFFAANGMEGKDLFDPSLPTRDGQYDQYHSGAINAFHASYFRRKYEKERAFQLCNLRKSRGFHMVCQGADPLPGVEDAAAPYTIRIVKSGAHVIFEINYLRIYHFIDDGARYGGRLAGGYIGFRQMAPLLAEYSDLTVTRIAPLANEGM